MASTLCNPEKEIMTGPQLLGQAVPGEYYTSAFRPVITEEDIRAAELIDDITLNAQAGKSEEYIAAYNNACRCVGSLLTTERLTSVVTNALSGAIERGHASIVSVTFASIQHRLDVLSYSHIFIAIEKNKQDIVKMLLGHAKFESDRDSFVYNAVKHENLELLDWMRTSGFNLNQKDALGRTPFIYSIEKHFPKSFDYFLKHGFNVNSRDEEGRTPLMLAANLARETEGIEMLIAKGANIHDVDNYNRRARDFAAKRLEYCHETLKDTLKSIVALL